MNKLFIISIITFFCCKGSSAYTPKEIDGKWIADSSKVFASKKHLNTKENSAYGFYLTCSGQTKAEKATGNDPLFWRNLNSV